MRRQSPARSAGSPATRQPASGHWPLPERCWTPTGSPRRSRRSTHRILPAMRAIVTGGAGFIGSNLVDGLLARGDHVTVIDDLSTGRRENLDGGIERDGSELAGVVEQEKPDAIFHMAAQIDVRRSLAEPAWDSSINVGGTINVLEAARIHGVARVVNTSTGGAIYGDAQTIPSDEQTPPLPEAAYGPSKLAAEGYLGLYERVYGLSSVN